jgi:hypothetical protein
MTRKVQPGNQIARPGRRLLRNKEKVTRNKCKFMGTRLAGQINPGQAFALEHWH